LNCKLEDEMEFNSNEILKELLPAEPTSEVLAATARADPSNSVGHSDHWSAAVMLERASYLRKLARNGDGSASETLREYPQHCAMLSFRSRDGEVEVHENFADVFFVLDGRATLVTGGMVVDARSVAPGEMRGSSIEGGTRQQLGPGDVAHVPAGVAHQMLVAGEKTSSAGFESNAPPAVVYRKESSRTKKDLRSAP
jgi:mannose-6-phosphate isomerase-like protein (cupin superfamily)